MQRLHIQLCNFIAHRAQCNKQELLTLTTTYVRLLRYTPAEFEDAVLALSPATAVFDCDGTLWSGDAGYGFMVWSIEAGLVSRNASDWIDSRYRLYLNGEVSETARCAARWCRSTRAAGRGDPPCCRRLLPLSH